MEKNKKDKTSIVCIILLIIQYLLLGFAYTLFMCSCGHNLINKVPVIIFLIFQCILFMYLMKTHSPYKLLFVFISMILLIIVVIFTRNDMNELHRIELYDEKVITNKVIDPTKIVGM